MQRRQIAISIFIFLVSALKIAEVTFRFETFPLTHTGMFEEYEPPERVPWTFQLEGFRRGRWREIRPWYLGLLPGAFEAKLGNQPLDIPPRCSALVQEINASRKPQMRYQRARVIGIGHARPGTGQVDRHVTINCMIAPVNGSVP